MSDLMNFKDIRTGVIGVGSMGQNHARIYDEISDLVAVSDPDSKQGKEVAQRYGVKWFENYKDMLEHVDAVSIAVPTFLHEDISNKVAKAKVHILVEKPLATGVKESQSIIDAAKENEIVLCVGHVERYNPVVSAATSFFNEKDSGNILTLTARRFSNYPSRISDVGVLYDLTIHDVDIISQFARANPVTVYASGGKSQNKNYEDYVNIIINFENGIIGVCQTNWLTPMKVRDLSITTDKNFVALDFLSKKVTVHSSEYLSVDNSNLYDTKIEFSQRVLGVREIEPLKEELVDFLTSIKKGKEPRVSGQDGLQAVRIVQAALESLKLKKIIKL